MALIKWLQYLFGSGGETTKTGEWQYLSTYMDYGGLYVYQMAVYTRKVIQQRYNPKGVLKERILTEEREVCLARG